MKNNVPKPSQLPLNPCFSCGPCAKHPGWDLARLSQDSVGRSHRSGIAKQQLKDVIDRTRRVLNIPDDYLIGIGPASETGVMELAMWNVLGAPGVGVDVLAWEHFSLMWLHDIVEELKLPDVRTFKAPFGELPQISDLKGDRDLVFAWNGTTSGVCVPEDWRPPAGPGLKICDATSAVFAYDMPWRELDIVTWPWQKGMGSEAQHGMMVFSPRAIERLKSYTPSWPMPKIFQLKAKNEVKFDFFDGVTINTPSMLCVADAIDALEWIESIGGLQETMDRVKRNAAALDAVVQSRDYLDYTVVTEEHRSRTSVTLRFTSPEFTALPTDQQQRFVSAFVSMLEKEKAAFDIKSYSTAPLGLRIWCGATVQPESLTALGPWFDWAYAQSFAA